MLALSKNHVHETTGSNYILIVDDEQETSRFFSDKLRHSGFEVKVTSNGKDALDQIREQRPDLILCDIEMPEMSGLDLLDHVRKNPEYKDVPYIALSGRSDIPTVSHCLEHGANDFVMKPVDARELISRVRLQLRTAKERLELQQKVYVDELTSIYNRRGLCEALDKEIKNLGRTRRPLSLLLIDVNKFKEINDTYGHLAGDLVLQQIASALSNAVRITDIVGRMGGDEFLAVLPDVTESQADAIVSRIRENMEYVFLPSTGESVSLAIGHVSVSDPSITLEQLLDEADQKMYDDKRRSSPSLTLI